MCHPGRPRPHGLSHAGSPGLAPFHRAKSRGSAFSSPGVDARSVPHLGRLLLGESAVRGQTVHSEVDVGARLIGVPLGDQPADQVQDLRDVLGGPRLHIRATQAEPAGVVDVGLGVLAGHIIPRPALGVRLLDDAIVDVGDVLHERNAPAQTLEVALGDHGEHVRSRVPQVDVVVDRRSAEVHGHVVAIPGDELPLLLPHRIV